MSQAVDPTAIAGSSRSPLQWLARRQVLGGASKVQITVAAIAAVILMFLTLVPLVYMIYSTVGGEDGSFSSFTRAYGAGSGVAGTIGDTLAFSVGASLLALVIGVLLAFVYVRTDVPVKVALLALSLVPLVLPGILYASAWIFLADKQIGVLNNVIESVIGKRPLDVHGIGGMIWVQGTHLAPEAFLLMTAAFRAMDPRLEEAALTSGSSWPRALGKVTLPLLRPAAFAALLLIFVQSIESFEIPAALGLQSKTYVFASRIYYAVNSTPADYPRAGAYGLGLLVIAIAGLMASRLATRGLAGIGTIQGKAFQPRTLPLGKWRPLVTLGVVLYALIAVILPALILVYASLVPYYAPPSGEMLKNLQFSGYRDVFSLPGFGGIVVHTIVVAVLAATAVMLISAVSSWVVTKTKVPGRTALDALTLTPMAVPGIVLGLALAFFYLRVPLPVYGTLAILVISYTTRFLPFGMRYASVSMNQIGADLEESAHVSGASWGRTFVKILLPLAGPGLTAGWIFIVLTGIRELSSTILLYSPGKEVFSVYLWQAFIDGKFTQLSAAGLLMVAVMCVVVAAGSLLSRRAGTASNWAER